MTARPVSKIEADPVHNLIRITYHGHVTAATVKALAEKAAVIVPKLHRGFTVLTDLTDMESMSLGCVPHVTSIMELCKAHGIATTVRVIPDPKKDIGLTILAVARYSSAVRILTYRSLAEAEAAMKL